MACAECSVANSDILTHVLDKLLYKWDTPCYTTAKHSTRGTLVKIENTVVQTYTVINTRRLFHILTKKMH
jgi:hypothetical protein